MALFLSVMGFLPDIFVERKAKETLETALSKKPVPSDERRVPLEAPLLTERATSDEQVSQDIEGLYLPTYDKAGKEQMVLKGERAVFINNRLYKISKLDFL